MQQLTLKKQWLACQGPLPRLPLIQQKDNLEPSKATLQEDF
ncbi:uncharacterized protein METZ01_LOCUS41366 [marine metagenome]|uniref:Uncharacterized protein n=1 Tax=marine metagenome TaxID=408172 RepID=A0A381R9Y8_9ZZZZ